MRKGKRSLPFRSTYKEPIRTLQMGTWTTAENKVRRLIKQGYKPLISLDKKTNTWKIEVYD